MKTISLPLFCLIVAGWVTPVDAFVAPTFFRGSSTKLQKQPRVLPPQNVLLPAGQQSLYATSWMVESVPAFTLLGESTVNHPVASLLPLLFLGAIGVGTFLPIVFRAAPVEESKNYDDDRVEDCDNSMEDDHAVRRKQRKTTQGKSTFYDKTIGIGRRGTIMTLVGTAASFAASDVLLGAAGNILGSGGAVGSAVASVGTASVYDAKWNAMFQRMVAHKNVYGAVASEELLEWAAASAAAAAPELRAWIAGQRALQKAVMVLEEAVVVGEGFAVAAAVTAAAAAASKTNDNVTAKQDEREDEVLEEMNLDAIVGDEEDGGVQTFETGVSNKLLDN
jgi:hypothetical protein